MLVKIGKIVNTKGLKGEIKILSSSDFKDERFQKGSKIWVEKNAEKIVLTVEKWTIKNTFDIIKFAEIKNINEAEKYKNCDIYGEEIKELENGEYLFKDLMGCQVYENNEEIGKIIDVFDNVNRTYLEIQLKKTKEKKKIPFIDEFITEINIENKTVEIKTIPGLIYDED